MGQFAITIIPHHRCAMLSILISFKTRVYVASSMRDVASSMEALVIFWPGG